jgi:glycosyltransferase involved in cell wall biosynthesis
MKVLHVASWYPNSKDPFDGDFVERQLKALSGLMHTDVIHVVQNNYLLDSDNEHTEHRLEGKLSAKIYFPSYPKVKSLILQKLLFARYYNKTMKRALQEYIQLNGRPDLIHIHVPVKAGYAALLMQRKMGIPFVVTEHSSSYYEHMADNYFQRSRYFQFITRQSFEKAAAVISVSDWLTNRLGELFTLKSCYTIRNVVDTKLFYPVVREATVKRFIHVSMMVPLKNVEGIIDALFLLLQKTSDWEMVFAGNASEDLKKRASALGSRVRFTGSIPYEQVAKEMQQADALVHFSNQENLPCVINEALCCGLPVISSNVGGIAEIINNNNGILVESKNTIELADALFHFLQQSTQYNNNAISRQASASFSYETIAAELINLYKTVLKKD